jgi:hypothetical protein
VSNTVPTEAEIGRVLKSLEAGVVATPDPSFKPDFSTPQNTYKVLNQAVKTNDWKLALTCMSPRLKADATQGVEGELLEAIGPAIMSAMGPVALGKQLSATDDVQVFEYSRNGEPVTNDDQRFVKIDGKWLLDN